MKKKKILILTSVIFVCFLIVGIGYFFYRVNSSEKKDGINAFPESYRPYLEAIQKRHPNWKFTALYTNLDWKYVIDHENVFGKNLVPISYSDDWKNTKPGEYNVEIDGGWVDCSRKAVEYTMDPRNFLNDVRIFQFHNLSYNSEDNKEVVEKILYGTEFYNNIVKYVTTSGQIITMNEKYSDLIYKGGVTSRVSPYHLASRIRQEVGPFLSHSSISGTVSGYEGYYNFYNIGATSSASQMEAIKKGLQYAKDGKGASQETKNKYLIPWDNKEKAITGGAIFIGSSYINQGQNTVYLQKFDVNDDKSGELFWHQYMTNVLAPYSESKSIYNGYQNSGILDNNLSFMIPVYQNMPTLPVQNPNIIENDFEADNTKVFANVTNTLNVRSGPSTSYETITTVNRNDIMTRVGKGKQSGELWDRVILSNGILGYIFQSYLEEVPEIPDVPIQEISLSLRNNKINKGEKNLVSVKVLPEDATNKEVTFSSNNTNVAIVDEAGNILGVGPGKAMITAKSKTNEIEASIEIEVYSPVTDILLDVSEIILPLEETYQLQPIIYPDDANDKTLTYSSSDNSIVKVNANGLMKAVGKGKTTIRVIGENNITKVVTVTVTRKIEDSELNFENPLKLNGNLVTGIEPLQNTVLDVKNKINTTLLVEFYNGKNEKLQDTDLVGTNTTIKISEIDGTPLSEYKCILFGDVNADGKINSVDLLVLQRHILEIEKFEGVFLKAGNINKNGKNPTSVDCLLIQRHILGLSVIQQ